MAIALLASFVVLASSRVAAPQIPAPNGVLVEPARKGGAAVLVLHPWWGLNEDTKAFCRRLAGAGFLAFAPDLFAGKTAKTMDEAMALLKTEDPRQAEIEKIVRDSAAYLEKKSGKSAIAVVGFSYGAYHALNVSNSDPHVRKVVVFYGTGPGHFGKSKASYMAHFAGNDQFNSKSDVDSTVNRIRKAKRPITVFTYPNTGHWFFEPSVPKAYKRNAAELAWKHTVVFLKMR